MPPAPPRPATWLASFARPAMGSARRGKCDRSRRPRGRLLCGLLLCRLVAINARFDLAAEMADQSLNGPGRCIPQRADGVALNPRRHVPEQIDLTLLGLATLHPLQDAPHPATALTARRTLSTTLVLVEVGYAADGSDDVGRFVHHDDGGGTHARLELGQRIEVEREGLADRSWQQRHGRAAGD